MTERTGRTGEVEERTLEQTFQERQLAAALDTLHAYILDLSVQAGEDRAYGETLWQEISRSEGLLQELAYYHDYGEFLCRYQVAGYTLADVLVWQGDHFKLYMDRPQDMNRYRRQRLLLSAFHTLARMEEEPTALMNFMDKMQGETGQDIP